MSAEPAATAAKDRPGDLQATMAALGEAARTAAAGLALADPEAKTRALLAAAKAIRENAAAIQAANAEDMAGGRAKGLTAALLDRLETLGQQFGLTFLRVTHDPAEAARIATRTISIQEGGRIGSAS